MENRTRARQSPKARSRPSCWIRCSATGTPRIISCVGQIYLLDNPLLREPLTKEHIKPRLLGHWGTSAGQNFIYVHLNRLIRETDANMIYISGPGHGGPTLNACAYLEGTYTEVHPEITQDIHGMRLLFRSFSTPGGIPSHCGPHTPNSMHEGGELGYSLVHAFGAAFDNPDLIVACVVGDGEAETCPLEGSWKGVKFLNPARDGAVLPILHLNGYKISGPTVMARTQRRRTCRLSTEGAATRLILSKATIPQSCISCLPPRWIAVTRAYAKFRRAARATDAAVEQRSVPAVADDHSAHAERLDVPERSGRRADRRNVSRAPGAALDRLRKSRAFEDAGSLDAEVQARRIIRSGRAA